MSPAQLPAAAVLLAACLRSAFATDPADTTNTTASDETEDENDTTKQWVIVAIAVFVVIVLLGFLVLSAHNKSAKKAQEGTMPKHDDDGDAPLQYSAGQDSHDPYGMMRPEAGYPGRDVELDEASGVASPQRAPFGGHLPSESGEHLGASPPGAPGPNPGNTYITPGAFPTAPDEFGGVTHLPRPPASLMGALRGSVTAPKAEGKPKVGRGGGPPGSYATSVPVLYM
eukprot:TRINITY_DN8278_c1_g1_i1.p1 TRINITY_DN8278_c1_g1~~TRINITY_DN8278_c1_g1_i1.p1  ORF type:complete len:227 (+),score=19.01 TRINITY_DN8278_c1_g1_i1:127-807(+)